MSEEEKTQVEETDTLDEFEALRLAAEKSSSNTDTPNKIEDEEPEEQEAAKEGKEQPEKKPDDEEEEESEEVKSVLKNPFSKDKEKKETDDASVNSEELESLKAKVEEYEKILEDPQVAWTLKQRSEGKNIVDSLQDIIPVDIKSLSVDDLYEVELKKLKADHNLSEEQVEEFRNKFNGLDLDDKLQKVSGIRKEILAENEKKKGLLDVGDFNFKPNPELQQKQLKDAQNKFIDDVTKSVESLKGEEIYGYVVTEVEQKEVLEAINKNPVKPFEISPEGVVSSNPEFMSELFFYRTVLPKAIRKLIKTQKTNGTIEAVKERANVSDPNNAAVNKNSSPPDPKQAMIKEVADSIKENLI